MYLKGAPQESFFWALQTQTWAMQIVLFYGDSVAVFKPSTVLSLYLFAIAQNSTPLAALCL